jgi:hypothetical protein
MLACRSLSKASVSSGVGIPDPLVLGYVLALATEGKAKRIFVVGADGYQPTDARQLAIENTLRRYTMTKAALPLMSLTKTSLPMHQRSLFAPL